MYSKCSKIFNAFCSQNMGYQGLSLKKACQNSKPVSSLSDCFCKSSQIWVCTVCLGLFLKTTSVQNFRTFTVHKRDKVCNKNYNFTIYCIMLYMHG